MSSEVAALVGFGRHLRAIGLPVGTGRILTFCRAVNALAPVSAEDVYWAARTTLVSTKEHIELLDRAFRSHISAPEPHSSTSSERRARSDPERPEETVVEVSDATWMPVEDDVAAESETRVRIVAGDLEILRNKSFEHLSDRERAHSIELIRRLGVELPTRKSRRLRPAPKGTALDLRRTLRASLQTEGEPLRRERRKRRWRLRPLVLILDVSGSMSPYSRALLQFGFAAIATGHRVEVFCFGTRLTRVTRALRGRDPDRALREIGHIVRDWDGGTRIGESLHELLTRYGQHGFLRGSVTVLCSDGLERGDPALLAAETQRLSRLAYRLVWVNPLKGNPFYEPLARGMAAALPHIDVFMPGHNLASLEELGRLLGR